MRDVCADFGAELREFNARRTHAHLLVNFPPRHRHLPAGQFAEGRVLPQAAARVPGPARPPADGPNGCGQRRTSPGR
jgi:hypothetical protein